MAKKSVKKKSEEQMNAIGADENERRLGSVEKILAHRQIEKSRALAQFTPAPPEPAAAIAVEHRDTPTEVYAQLLARVNAADADRRAARLALVEPEARELIARGRGAQSTHGALRSKHLDHAVEVANFDWTAIRAAVPPKLEPRGPKGALVDVAGQAVWMLQRAATHAVAMLRSSFGSANPGKDDVDPPGLDGMIAAVEAMLAGGTFWDARDDMPNQMWKRAINHLEVWVQRATGLANGTREAVERFVAAEDNFRATVTLPDDAAAPPRAERVPVPETPAPKPPAPPDLGDPRDYDQRLAEYNAKVAAMPKPVREGSVNDEPVVVGMVLAPEGR